LVYKISLKFLKDKYIIFVRCKAFALLAYACSFQMFSGLDFEPYSYIFL